MSRLSGGLFRIARSVVRAIGLRDRPFCVACWLLTYRAGCRRDGDDHGAHKNACSAARLHRFCMRRVEAGELHRLDQSQRDARVSRCPDYRQRMTMLVRQVSGSFLSLLSTS